MNNSPRVLSFDDVIDLCGSVATSRGQVCKTSGAVRDLDWIPDGNVLYACVYEKPSDQHKPAHGRSRKPLNHGGPSAGKPTGSSLHKPDDEPFGEPLGEPFHVRIVIAPHRFESECSCSARKNCKHVAATLLCWIERQTVHQSDDDKQLRAVNRWLQGIVEQSKRTVVAHEHHEPGEPLLFYQLDNTALTQNTSGITLKILQSRLLKRGGYGKETPYRYNSQYYHPEWVLPSDRAILDLAVGKNNDLSYKTITVEGDIGHLLFNKLVECQRCFWGTQREQPISRESARVLSIEWLRSDDTHYRLKTTLPGVEHWQLVPTDPPWYIDTVNMHAGPLEKAPPTALLSHFIQAPPLPAAHVQVVSNYLASRLPDTRLPLPTEPDFIRVHEKPRPLLVLQSHDQSPDIRHYVATIRFRYGDYVLPFDGMDADATLEGKTSDGHPLVIKRDLAGEIRHVVEFSKLFPDFEPARNTDDEPGSKADRSPRMQGVQQLARQWRELLDARKDLENRGWVVQIRPPFDLSFKPVTRLEATISETPSAWFDMALQLSHNGQQFDLLPLVIDWLQNDSQDDAILLQANDGQWLEVAPELFKPVAKTLLELYDDPTQAQNLEIPKQRAMTLQALDQQWAQQGVSVAWHDTASIFDLAEKLRNFDGITPPPLPDGVNAQLRSYQLEGLAWLDFLAEYGFNGILADDMGLGKTLQTLAHIQQEHNTGRLTQPTLIVAPTSLLGNWQREAARFTPQLSTLIWHGTQRKASDLSCEPVNIVITSYTLATRDIELLEKQHFGCIVLDEAQSIKNPTAKVTQALKTLTIPRRLCLSGTPLENHLGELWSQFDFLMPGFLGSRKHFNRYFRIPIENHASDERQARLSELIRPFLLRRCKEQVATELPAKTEIIREVALEPEQARLYESIRVSMEHRVRALLAERGLAKSHIEMLDALLKLRQTCCHPALVKLDSARGVHASAKTELLLSMLEELIREGKKILLFSQFTEMLALIEKELEQRDIDYVKLTGRTRKRDTVIDAFQHGDVPLFLISLKAGGTGLNLTAADTVIHYDPWWNPAVENQASDRAHRIGQNKPVFIYKLVASNTVEEKIMAMQARKQQLADQTVNQRDSSALQGLTADDVLNLFSQDFNVPSA